MNFSHPELQRFHASLAETVEGAGVESARADDPIYQLMVMADHFRMAEWDAGSSLPLEGEAGWEPRSPELRELIDLLTAPERRDGLRRWYFDAEEMNSAASGFRDWLATAINEQLRPQQTASPNHLTRSDSNSKDD